MPKPRARVSAELLTRVRNVEPERVAAILAGLAPRTVLSVLIQLAVEDEPRLFRLLARNDVFWQLDVSAKRFARGLRHYEFEHAQDALVTMATAMVANLNKTGATFGHAFATHMLAQLVPPDRRFDFYIALIANLDAEPHRSRVVRLGGLHNIYMSAAKAAFEARSPEDAVDLSGRALALADQLPESQNSAQARFVCATRRTGYLAHASSDLIQEMAADAHALVEAELLNLLAFDPPNRRELLMRAALAGSNLWESAAARKLIGTLVGARERVKLLEGALTAAYGSSFADGAADAAESSVTVAAAPEAERLALGKTLGELAQSYTKLGEESRAAWFAFESERYGLSLRSRLVNGLTLIRAMSDTGAIVGRCEEFARSHITGGLARLPDRQLTRLLRDYSAAARRLANLLDNNKQRSASVFWELQGKLWLAEAQEPTNLWRGPGDDESGVLRYVEHAFAVRELRRSPAARASARARERQRIRQLTRSRLGRGEETSPPSDEAVAARRQIVAERMSGRLHLIGAHIDQEDVGEIIEILWSTSQSPHLVFDESLAEQLRDAIGLVVDWRPEFCGEVKPYLRDRGADDGADDDLVAVALRAAVALARAHVPYRTAFLLLALSARPGVPAAERIEVLREAADAAHAQGRSALELSILLSRLQVLEEQGTPMPDEEIQAGLSDILTRSDASAFFLGISGVYDRARSLAESLADIAEALAVSGRNRIAFRTTGLAQGLIVNALVENPELAAELTDAMKAGGTDKTHRKGFYTTVLNRICGPEPAARPAPGVLVRMTEESGEPGAAAVRLVCPSSGRVWAIGRSPDLSYFSADLGTTAQELLELSEAVWFRLRPPTDPVDRDNLLRHMYDVCVAPLQPWLYGVSRITFAFHDRVPFLPLHGALGPDGFLGAQMPVGYEIDSDAADDPDVTDPRSDAAVLGWDPSTLSDREALAISGILGEAFTIVPTASASSAVTDVILNPDRSLAVLHIAGHGHLHRHPHAMDSFIELTEDVVVTALDLLRSGCRCRFVFLNVCSVGNSEQTAGDSYGFALAVRAHGARALLAPAAYVTPHDAKTFATRFYTLGVGSDAVEAVHLVTRELVAGGAAPHTWIPYAIFGRLPVLS